MHVKINLSKNNVFLSISNYQITKQINMNNNAISFGMKTYELKGIFQLSVVTFKNLSH